MSASTAWAGSAAWRCARRWAGSIGQRTIRAPDNRLDIVHVNELKGGAATTAHLLEFDSVHGRWRENFGAEDDRAILVGNRRIGFSAAPTRRWRRLGRSRLRHRAGMHRQVPQEEQLAGYFARGVKRVIVAAPVKEAGALNIVVGVNDHRYDPREHRC